MKLSPYRITVGVGSGKIIWIRVGLVKKTRQNEDLQNERGSDKTIIQQGMTSDRWLSLDLVTVTDLSSRSRLFYGTVYYPTGCWIVMSVLCTVPRWGCCKEVAFFENSTVIFSRSSSVGKNISVPDLKNTLMVLRSLRTVLDCF